MNRLIYILQVSVKRTLRNGGFNIMLLLSFYVGLLLPAFCASSASYYMNEMKRFEFEDYDNSVYISYFSEMEKDEQFYDMKEAVDGKHIEAFVRNWDVVPEFNNANVTTYGVWGDYDQFEDVSVVEGRKLSRKELDNKEHVCMVARNLMEKFGCHINDKITIGAIEFTIAGSIRDSSYTGYVLIPYGCMKELYKDIELQQEVSISTADADEAVLALEQYMMTNFPEREIVQLMKQEELTGSFKDLIKDLIQVRVFVGIGAYIFSVLNIIMLVWGKAYESRKRYAVQEAEGLSTGGLFLEFLTENLFLAVLANAVLSFTIMPVGRLLGLDSEMIYDRNTAVIILLFSVCLCVLLSLVLILRLKKQSVSNILSQER